MLSSLCTADGPGRRFRFYSLATIVIDGARHGAGGWGPAIVANVSSMIWFLAVSVMLIRRHDLEPQVIQHAA